MLSELKTVLRTLLRAPGYSLTVIVTLALGIGATATFYSMFMRTFFPPTPYAAPEQIVRLELRNPDLPSSQPLFMMKFFAYREAKSLTMLAGATFEAMNVVVKTEPEGMFVARVTENFFPLLGVTPALGRTFLPEENKTGAENVVVLSDWFWRNRLGADPAVLGSELKLNGRAYRIVGVLPRNFVPPIALPGDRSVYIPFVLPAVVPDTEAFYPVSAIGRLAPGATLPQVRTELATIRPGKGKPYERFVGGSQPLVSPVTELPVNPWAKRYGIMLSISLAAVACLYAIAAVNAGSLVLVRMLGRRREIGIRLALGGKRWDVMRPFVWESLLLSLGATLLGAIIAQLLMPALLALEPGRQQEAFRMSWESAGFLAGLGLLTGLGVVLAPAWHTTRLNINDVVKDGSPAAGEGIATRRLRGILVVIEAALAVILLTGAGLMVRTFTQLSQQKPGYETEHRYGVQLSRVFDKQQGPEERTQRRRLLLERMSAVPGVSSAALAMAATPNFYWAQKIKIAGRSDGAAVEAQGNPVSEGLLETLGVPLRAGRSMATQRPTDAPAVWINETMARMYFAGRSPLGERLEGMAPKPWEIAGVVGDQISQRDGAKPRFYFPHWQAPHWEANHLVLRLTGEPGPKFAAEVRRAVYEVDPQLAVMDIQSLEQHRRWEVAHERLASSVLQVLSALALLLAVTGLFAMMAYSVAQRRAEFGVRLALGATAPSLYRLVLGSGVGLAAAGVGIGLAVAWGLARFLEALLINTPSHDPLIFALVGLLMLIVAVPACWLPARRATRVDLTKLLRSE